VPDFNRLMSCLVWSLRCITYLCDVCYLLLFVNIGVNILVLTKFLHFTCLIFYCILHVVNLLCCVSLLFVLTTAIVNISLADFVN